LLSKHTKQNTWGRKGNIFKLKQRFKDYWHARCSTMSTLVKS